MSTEKIYCRLCAEEKSYAEIKSVTTREDLRELIEKLSSFGISFVDFSIKMLPNTVCITCYELLVAFYEFFVKIRRSQDVLSEICGLKLVPENVLDIPNHEIVKAESDYGDGGEYLQDYYSPGSEDIQSHLGEEKYKEIKIIKKETETPPKDTLHANSIENGTWDTYPWQCALCDSTMGSIRALREHSRDYHLKCCLFKCVDCKKQLNSFVEFVEHASCHRSGLRNICPYCNIDMGFEDLAHIKQHTISLYPCTLCGELYQNEQQLRIHSSSLRTPLTPKKRRKRPLTGKDSTCDICGVITKTPATMKNHLKMHTDRKRNYTCERCGKAYYTKGYLDAHCKIHEKKSVESCQICQKAFLTITRLKKHVRTHNLDMPYQCDACKKLFSSKDRIREHVKVHMDIMPFQCPYCFKKFRHKSIMKTHIHQHTGERPYSCDICCMDFANWSNCDKHMKRKHGTTLAKNVMTPHGKLALNPDTGEPGQLVMDNVVKEWSLKMLMKGRKKVQIKSKNKRMASL